MLKQECGFRFLKAKKVLQQANAVRAQVQRQQFALVLLRLLEQGHRIVNVDET